MVDRKNAYAEALDRHSAAVAHQRLLYASWTRSWLCLACSGVHEIVPPPS